MTLSSIWQQLENSTMMIIIGYFLGLKAVCIAINDIFSSLLSR
jgi:hypothetical protein